MYVNECLFSKLKSMTEADVSMYISKCCDAFIIFDGITCKCSVCRRELGYVQDQPLTIGVKFNDSTESNVSGDILATYRRIASRFSTDPTYEICSKRCPVCNDLSRYARDAQDHFIFICSNGSCRHVH